MRRGEKIILCMMAVSISLTSQCGETEYIADSKKTSREMNSNNFSPEGDKKSKIYITDRGGERWDITQAVSIGFKPENFQFGLGRDAFKPLDDTFLKKDTSKTPSDLRIIGIAEESDAQAYSIPKLTGHEIANTTLGSEPIAAAYWPLVDLATVYSRRIDGRVLTLVPSGWTYDNTFVLYDRETGTLWFPYEKGLMGIQGTYFKRWLDEIPSEDTVWEKWKKKHPNAKILQ